MIEEILNEIRTSNLEHIKQLKLRDVWNDYPVELARLIYKTLKENGYDYEEAYAQDVIKNVKISGFFFFPADTNKITFDSDFYLSFMLKAGGLVVKVGLKDPYYVTSLEVFISLKSTVEEMLDKIISFLKENKIDDDDPDKMKKIKELRDKYSKTSQYPKQLTRIKSFAYKKHINLIFDKDDNGQSIILLSARFNDILPPSINTIDYEKSMELNIIENNYKYTFQLEFLQEVLDKLIPKIEAVNNYIVKYNFSPNSLKLEISDKSGESIDPHQNIKIKQIHNRLKERLSDLRKHAPSSIKEMSFEEFKRHSIKVILGE